MAKNPRKTLSLAGRLALGLAKSVLIAAGILALAALVLTVVWWRLVSWPYRNLEPRRRSHLQREALLALLTAIGTLVATRRRRSPHDTTTAAELAG